MIVMQLMQVQSTKTHIRRRRLVRRLLGRYTLTIQTVVNERKRLCLAIEPLAIGEFRF